jgi:imidazolonepropionase-like amidohydrolase
MKNIILILGIFAINCPLFAQKDSEVDIMSINFSIDKPSRFATDKAAFQAFAKTVGDKMQELLDSSKLPSGVSKNSQQDMIINCRFAAGQFDGLVELIKAFRNDNPNPFAKRYSKSFAESYVKSFHLIHDSIAFKKNYVEVLSSIFQKLTLDDLPQMEQMRTTAQKTNVSTNWNDFVKALPSDTTHAINIGPALSLIIAYIRAQLSYLREAEIPLYNTIITKLENSKGNPIAAQFSLPTKPLALTHVNVINVITGKIESDQTILIEKDKITSIGRFNNIKLPKDVTIIDATGKFAMPGMTDGHIHFFQSGGLYTRPDGYYNLQSVYPYDKDQQWIKDNLHDLMARYIACGVTNIIDVGGPMRNFVLRDKVNNEITSPNALVTGPLISTVEPKGFDKNDLPIIKANSPEEAREMVRKQVPFKPDFIKIWYLTGMQDAGSNLPIVKAAIEESHANGLRVCVHATQYETAKLAVEAGADILVHSVDDKLLDAPILTLFKNKNIVYIPTLQVSKNYDRMYTQQFSFTPHDFKYANPFMLGSLTDLQHYDPLKINLDYKAIRKNISISDKQDTILSKNLLAVQKAGITVVSGTDAGNIGTHHGSSFMLELQLMKEAGLTNWEVLQSATINAAKGFGKSNVWGSLEQNKIADILILDGNPLDDLSTLAEIPTIIHRGVVIKNEQLLTVSPEILVQQQLNAYNARDIEAFLQPYSDSVELYNFPDQLIMKGKQEMRKSYAGYFKSTPDLHCEIVKRIVLGNTIIDHERVSGNGNPKRDAVAIYKTENGKITKVYFTGD